MIEVTRDQAAELQRAAALCDLGRSEEAASVLRRLLAEQPQSVRAWTLLALAELRAGNPDAGLRAAERAISLAPDEEWPHRLASAALKRLERYEEAIWHARECVRLDPNSWETHATLAQLLAKDKHNKLEAHQAADRALELAADQAGAHVTVGVVAAAYKERAQAEAAFRRALAIDPQNSVAHNELARVQLRGARTNPGALASAATGFASSVQIDPRGKTSRLNLDVVMRSFLSRISYFVFIDAYIISRIASSSNQSLTRLLPLAALVIPAVFSWQFLRRLTPELRRHLLGLFRRDGKIQFAAILEALAVALLIVAAFAPASSRVGIAGGAAGAALIGRLVLYEQVKKSSRAARGLPGSPTFSTPVLWFVAVALMLLALFALLATSKPGAGPGAVVIAIISAAGSAAIVYRIKRRRSASGKHESAI